MTDDSRYSRPVAAATKLGEFAEDRHCFIDKRVLLTGEREVLATSNGRTCFESSLQLLIRICRTVHLGLPAGFPDLMNACRDTVDQIAFGGSIEFVGESANPCSYDAILRVGENANPELPMTVINSDGWLARVSSGSTNLPAGCEQSNPIGALAAACLGVGEVFKRLIRLKPSRGRLVDGLHFSLYSYCSGEVDLGPALPNELPLGLLLAGAGAIGNGIIYLLSKLPVTGRAWVVDAQDFRPENLGTCLLIGPRDVGTDKAAFAAQFLSRRLDVTGFREDLAVFTQRLGREIPFPRTVLAGLDNVDARHEVQRLWPDLIIDGAISDFACQVSRHPWEENTACLICLFRHPPGELAEKLASRATGLTAARVQQGLEVVTDEDVQNAPSNKQEWLRSRKDHQICSVVQEAEAQEVSLDRQREGFEPSVPFVACLSACMVVSELAKSIAGWPSSLQPRFQLDALRGPAYGQQVQQERRRDCICVTRQHNIETIRRRRA